MIWSYTRSFRVAHPSSKHEAGNSVVFINSFTGNVCARSGPPTSEIQASHHEKGPGQLNSSPVTVTSAVPRNRPPELGHLTNFLPRLALELACHRSKPLTRPPSARSQHPPASKTPFKPWRDHSTLSRSGELNLPRCPAAIPSLVHRRNTYHARRC